MSACACMCEDAAYIVTIIVLCFKAVKLVVMYLIHSVLWYQL